MSLPPRATLVQSGVPKTASGGHAMSDHAAGKRWQEAQDRVPLEEFRTATGNAAKSMEEAEKWFLGLLDPQFSTHLRKAAPAARVPVFPPGRQFSGVFFLNQPFGVP